MPIAPETLHLDEHSLHPDELSVGALMRELNLRERPSWLLRLLMSALDKKRQARAMGWSRPWNKSGMTVFRTHRQHADGDATYLDPVFDLVREFAPEPLLTRWFIDDLFADPEMMAFTFYHNRVAGGVQYEGLTVSFGRHVAEDRSKRDRLDLILEDRRIDGRVDGHVDLARVIVCPWSSYGVDRDHYRHEQCEFLDGERARFDAVYQHCIRHYHAWKDDDARQWSHWSSEYMDYFGPRQFIPPGTSFT